MEASSKHESVNISKIIKWKGLALRVSIDRNGMLDLVVGSSSGEVIVYSLE